MNSLYLIAYDIKRQSRRRKVANWLENRGQRVQYSVFECVIKPAALTDFIETLTAKIKLTEDQLILYPLCGKCLRNNNTFAKETDLAVALDTRGYSIL